MIMEFFAGRKVVIATMHKKEEVIVPVLKQLGLIPVIPKYFDTDRFGTFSGEIERLNDPLQTARLKCKAASEQYDCSLAISSEGSFGPHPGILFASADDEIVVLSDLQNGLEFKARIVTTNTNFYGAVMKSWQDVEQFANAALFPSHALIARKEKNALDGIVKGIHTWEHLREVALTYLHTQEQFFLETDMRAMFNPTRMKVIEEVTLKLLSSIRCLCPQCKTPGFDVIEVVAGLPCELCSLPTKSTLSHVLGCQKCNYTEERRYPHQKTCESPMYCDWCNP